MTQATGYKLPQSVISNTGWENADRTSFNDGTFAYTVDSFNRLVVGNFQLNIPQDRNIYNIEVIVTGKRNSYPTTLKIWAIDNTTGVEQAYALSPDFNSFTGNNTTFTLANTLFGTSWTVDEINNIKLALEADGELYIDSVALNVTYYDVLTQPTDGSPITGGTSGSGGNGVGIDGSVVCETLMDEFIQAQPFQLARSAKSDDTFFILKSFSLPNGVPITMEMVNGNLYGVAEQGNGSQEETVKITDIIHNYNGTGLVKIDFGSLSNRGLDFKFPYTSVSSNIKYHVGGAEFVLSNPAVMYTQFLKDSDIGCTISAPISVEDEGVLISSYLRSLNFTGLPITASSSVNINGGQDVTVNVTSPGDYVPPTITGTSSGTTGTSMATSLQWIHSVSGVDRLLVVDVVTHETSTITGVTYDGNALVKLSEQTRVSGNLRLERWYMIAPTVGIHTIQVNVNTFSYISGGARGFSGADQTTPFDNVTVGSNGSSLSPINSVTTLANASIVIDALGTSLQPITHTEDSGQDVNFRITNSANRQISGGSQATGTSGTFNTNYELSVSTDWVMLSSAVKGIQLPTSVAGQTDIQFQDESINLGTSGTVDTVDFTGSGVTATRTGNKVTVNVTGGGGGAGTDITQTITQTAHGFVVGDWVRSSYVSGQYTKAQADTADNSAVIGLVTAVPNANTFELTKVGSASITTGYPIGDALWLSPTTAGAMTNVEPTTIGQIRQPLGYVVGTNEIDIKIQRGDDITSSSGGSGGTFVKRIITKLTAVTSGAATTFVIPHGLGTTPSEMNIEGKRVFDGSARVSSGYSNFSGINTCIGSVGIAGSHSLIYSSSACLHITNTGGFMSMVFTATADSTNITLSSYTPNGIPEEIYLIIDLFI